MSRIPRVALICETFHEINGVALTVRQLAAFAERREYPFLCVRPGPRVAAGRSGSVGTLELPRSFASFGIESDLRYDLFLWRHSRTLRRALEQFRPDVVHVTSPGEFGQLGALLSHSLRIPLVASWHTNLHQYAGRRLAKWLSFGLPLASRRAHDWAERNALRLMLRFYRIARVTLAPTAEQARWLGDYTGKPSFVMPRGVDCEQFHPRFRAASDSKLRLGFVGRVTPEKNVRLLVEIERALIAAGHRDFSILVVGDGSERPWLQSRLQHGDFRGVLRGPALAEAFADLDLFVFPSRTDTFGNVVQEAAASGVPSVVTSEGGPGKLVVHGVTGAVASSDSEFVGAVLELAADRLRLRRMGLRSREHVLDVSWDAAFESTYAAYRYCLQQQTVATMPTRPQLPVMPSIPAASR